MSIEARQKLVGHPNIFFQNDRQKADLLDPEKTQTSLIALLIELVIVKGQLLVITAVRSDHHDDSALGLHCHANGYAVDCWPLTMKNLNAYADGISAPMTSLLVDASRSTWLHQIGLAGSADESGNHALAGPTAFSDSGPDHIHLGAV